MNAGDLTEPCQTSLAAILTYEHSRPVVDYQRHVLSELRRAFDADAACFFVYKGDEDEPHPNLSFNGRSTGRPPIDYDAFVAENLDPATGRLYREYYLELDPFAQALADMGPRIAPLATAGTDLLAPGTRWKDTEFYADFMLPRNVHHLMCLRLVDGHRISGLISLYRSARRQGFSGDDLTQAQVFTPALTSGLAKAQISSQMNRYRQLVDGFDRISDQQGLLVLDRDRHWQAVSPQLDSWLREGPPDQRERFHRQLAHKINVLCEIDRAAADSGLYAQANTAPYNHMDVVRDGVGRLLRLTLVTPHPADHSASKLVLVEPLERDSAVAQNARQYGLSPRQHQVAQMLVDGFSSAEIADKLCLSTATVNNHIRALYAKVRVDSRGKFIHTMSARTDTPQRD